MNPFWRIDSARTAIKLMMTDPDGSKAHRPGAKTITSLDLHTDTTHIALDVCSPITGQTTYTMNLTQIIAATLTLAAEAEGHEVTNTLTL